MPTYSDKLKDPRWQKKRLEVLERDGWACRYCGDTKNTLHVHHVLYLSGREPWEYELGVLLTSCKSCHPSEPWLDDDGNHCCSELECLVGTIAQSWMQDYLGVAHALCLVEEEVVDLELSPLGHTYLLHELCSNATLVTLAAEELCRKYGNQPRMFRGERETC